ncbi:MAG: type II secretion system protein [Fimbriimonadaceae bacterium]
MNRRAFTLVEILFAVAILAPLVGQAKSRAADADAIARLRQLGAAAVQYEADTGRFPARCMEAARAGGLPTRLCLMERDTVGLGMGQHCSQKMNWKPPPLAPHRYTFVGYADLGWTWDQVQQWTKPGTNIGWVADPSPGKMLQGRCDFRGRYHRLLLDGAVVSRQLRLGRLSANEQVYQYDQLLADFDEAWYRRRGR